MIRLSVGSVQFRLHVLMLIMAGLALTLGVSRELLSIALALCVHETSHILAARIAGVEIEYIEIMPFGGAAHVRDLYSERGGAIVLTALAGPLANLLMMLAGAALGWWGLMRFPQAARMIRVNGMLALFNMLPALPLDGGRVLYAAAGRALGRRTAVNIAAGVAYALAALLAILAAGMYLSGGRLNISFVIMAAFLAASTWSERRSALDDGATRAIRGLCREHKLPKRAQLVALDADAPTAQAARFMGGPQATLFATIRGGHLEELLSEGDVAARIMAGERGTS